MLEHIEKHLPDVKKFVDKNVFKNDNALKLALSKGYNILPFYVRAIFKEEAFVSFCVEHKHVIFGDPPKKVVKKPAAKKKVTTTKKK